MDSLSKITSLTLENFRGFIGQHKLDVDADIVLIQAPNGFGKSSLLEALLAILTGHTFLPNWRQALTSKRNGCYQRQGAIEIQCKCAQQPRTFRVEWDYPEPSSKGALDPFPRPDGFSHSSLIDDPELAFRLCGYFPEYVNRLFDESASGRTLRDVVEKPHAAILALLSTLDPASNTALQDLGESIRSLDKNIADIENNPNHPQRLRQAYPLFFGQYEPFQQRAIGWPELPPMVPSAGQSSAESFLLDTFKSAAKLPSNASLATAEPSIRTLRSRLRADLDHLINVAKQRAGDEANEQAAVQAKIAQIDASIKTIDTQHPSLEIVNKWFLDADGNRHCDALAVLRSLRDNAKRWGNKTALRERGVEKGRIEDLQEAFLAVDTAHAAALAECLEYWWNEISETLRRREKLANEKAKLEKENRALRKSEELRALENIEQELFVKGIWHDFATAWAADCEWTHRARQLDDFKSKKSRLQKRDQSLRGAYELLDEITRTPEYLAGLTDTLNYIVQRFRMVDGLYPFRLSEDGKLNRANADDSPLRLAIRADDGRSLMHLSGGQKSQLGVSLLVAQNLYLRRFLPHRILLLDDVSAGYDLSNLSREVILWRQLAYGQAQESDCYRQIFRFFRILNGYCILS
ncbi:MAG: AAA family ATPase [Gammaproteobacteria bacterium]|nr:AAA family ATPase [Gammaproteobacteria bacterium]